MKKDIRKTTLKEGEIIPLTFDYMFTEILNDKNNIEILEDFISCYLDIEIEKVRNNLKLKSRKLKIENKKNHNKEVDLLLDYNGEKYNIELSNKKSKGVVDRNIVYASNIHGRQLKYGDNDYIDIQKTIQINLNNFVCNERKLIETYYFTNEEGKILSEKIRIDNIDMEKAEEVCYTGSEREKKIARWIKVIKSVTDRELENNIGDDLMRDISKRKLKKRIKELSSDDEVIRLYTKLPREQLEFNTYMREAKEEGYNEGHELGYNEGHESGYSEGHESGYNDGIQQGIYQKSVETAKSMLNEGLDINLISKITGLSLEEINSIKQQ